MSNGQDGPIVGANPVTLNRKVQTVDLTIASSGTDSTALDVSHFAFGMILIPAALTGATLAIKGSMDGTNFFPINDQDEAALSITGTEDNIFRIPDDAFGVPWIQFVSASAEGAERTLTVSLVG